jgi:hypothetical protein
MDEESEMEAKAGYSVWAGGVEVNDNLLSLKEAEALAADLIDQGYDDVAITSYEDE